MGVWTSQSGGTLWKEEDLGAAEPDLRDVTRLHVVLQMFRLQSFCVHYKR